MRKIPARLLALCLAVLMLSMVLASCGNRLTGTYENNTFGLVTSYTFSGNEFVRSMRGLSEFDVGTTVSGTYRISGGTIYLTTSLGIEEELTFSKSGDTIYIANMEFVKK